LVGTVVPNVLLRWMPSRLSPLAVAAVSAAAADDDADNDNDDDAFMGLRPGFYWIIFPCCRRFGKKKPIF